MAEHKMTRDAQTTAPDEQAAAPLGGAPLGQQDDVLRVPEVEEHLLIERRRIALGFIEIRKTVVTEQVMVPVELRHEVVEYRLVDDPGGVATIGEARGDLKDDSVRIPLFREKAVVHKEIVVTSEVVIDRTLIADEQTLDETLRRTRVTVDERLAHTMHASDGSSETLLSEHDSPPPPDRGAERHAVRPTNAR
jgi:uncharacterized protein (TIGR02271 family)